MAHQAPQTVARDALRSNVTFRRAQLRLSQSALSQRSGLSRAVVSAIENGDGNVKLESLARLAGALGCSVADLLAQTEHRPRLTEAELARRAAAGPEDFVDAGDFIAALDDRAGRYSPRGRRRKVARQAAS